MSKKFLAALLAVLMVVAMVPMSAMAVDAPTVLQPVPANLRYQAGLEGPKFGQATTYTTELSTENGVNTITIKATDLVKTTHGSTEYDPASAYYNVGIALPNATTLWADMGVGAKPETVKYRWWMNDFQLQTTNSVNYSTFYWSFSSLETANNTTGYLSVLTKAPEGGIGAEYGNVPIDYIVKFELSAPAEKGTLQIDNNITNGSIAIDPEPGQVVVGELVVITPTPEDNKKVKEVSYTGTTNQSKVVVTEDPDLKGTYSFKMPKDTITVTAVFEAASPNDITVDSGISNGRIQVDPTSAVKGKKITVTPEPNDGYMLGTITMTPSSESGQPVYRDADGYYTFIMPEKAVTVTATFVEIPKYTITVTTPENGIVTADKATAAEGEKVTLTTVDAASGYRIKKVTYRPANSTPIELTSPYEFDMPGANVTVTAEFEEIPATPPVSSGSSGGSSTTNTVTTNPATNGTVTASATSAKEGDRVTVTVTPNAGYVATGITVTDASGNRVAVSGSNGTYTFTMPKSAVTVSATISHMYDLFTDVPKTNAEYGTAIKWAVEKGITLGTSTTTFSPNNPCTRGQMVVFLYRAAGSPDVTGTNAFTDVPANNAEMQKAVQWAVNKGITQGTSATKFSPNAPCTRGQMVTFLHRNAGETAATGSNDFADVPADAYYKTAVQWAVDNGITKGTSDTTFAPGNNCTRVQMVTFLYRYMGK